MAALANELACPPRTEHSERKVSIAVVAAAAAVCRHRAMTAWTSGMLVPREALVTMSIMQFCSDVLISTSFARSCSTDSTSSGSRDDIEGLLRS